jgi:hypothetical protein
MICFWIGIVIAPLAIVGMIYNPALWAFPLLSGALIGLGLAYKRPEDRWFGRV